MDSLLELSDSKIIAEYGKLPLSKDTKPEEILKIILAIFSEIIKKMDKKMDFDYFNFSCLEIKNHKKISPINDKTKISFETNVLYQYLLKQINEFLPITSVFSFNSNYSALYFRKIINYLSLLFKSNKTIVNDDLVKIFFFLFFLSIDEYFKSKFIKFNTNRIVLDEAFYKGTFIELIRKYSSEVSYTDSEEIKNIISKFKNKAESDILGLVDYSFQRISDYLEKDGKKSDEKINDMYNKIKQILYGISQGNEKKLPTIIIEEINKLYSQEEYITLINYVSDTEIEDLENNIDTNFLNGIKNQYSSNLTFNYSQESSNIDHKEKLIKYLDYKNKKYKRMSLSYIPQIALWNLNEEEILFSVVDNNICLAKPDEFEKLDLFKRRLKNLDQDNILKIFKEIMNDNEYLEYFFSILRNDIIKYFFTSYLYLDENDNEYQIFKNNSNNSDDFECFRDIYNNFLEQYDNKEDGYKKFKNLFILKILPYGDRAYTINPLKKIAINPAQFFLGKDIIKDENEIKTILKGYFMIVLLHETAHFLRLFYKNNNNNKVFEHTPRGKEGGEMFIKYLFGVRSINHINKTQAENILNYNNWKDHDKIKNIFKGQLEDSIENNINEFISNYFSNSISFYSTNNKMGKNEKSTKIKK